MKRTGKLMVDGYSMYMTCDFFLIDISFLQTQTLVCTTRLQIGHFAQARKILKTFLFSFYGGVEMVKGSILENGDNIRL